jgi:hypothetical protein
MSLAQHVSAVEGYDHEPEPGDPAYDAVDSDRVSVRSFPSFGGSIGPGHRLARQPSLTLSISYDPLPPPNLNAGGDKATTNGAGTGIGSGNGPENVAAYEVSNGKRIGKLRSRSFIVVWWWSATELGGQKVFINYDGGTWGLKSRGKSKVDVADHELTDGSQICSTNHRWCHLMHCSFRYRLWL